MKWGVQGWSHTCRSVLPASTKLLFRTQLPCISIGTKRMLFVSVLIKSVPVACAALCASPGYVLVNSLQRQQCCPWIKQNNLFTKRSLMDGLDSLQKHSSPCLNSLKHFSTWKQNPEMGMAESHAENWWTEIAFSFLCFLSVSGRLDSWEGRIWECKSSPNAIAPNPWLYLLNVKGWGL